MRRMSVTPVCDSLREVNETDASSARTEPPFGDVAEPSMGNCWYLNCRLAILLAARSLSSIFRAFKQAIGRREMQYAFNF